MNDKRLRIGVIFGGRSGEHEISLLSARSILSAINPDEYEVTQIGITHDGMWLVGEDLLTKFESGVEPNGHMLATILPDPSRRAEQGLPSKAKRRSGNRSVDGKQGKTKKRGMPPGRLSHYA